MKLSVFLLICSIGLVQAADSYAQKATVSLEMRNQTVKEVLDEIEEQSDFSFFFNIKHVDLQRKVSVVANKSDIFKVLDNIFAGTNVHYSIVDKKIILSTEISVPKQSQSEKRITGVVTDEKGDPIVGANIVEKGTINGVVTDIDGKFNLTVSDGASFLVSYIGYNTQEIKVGNKNVINITMLEDLKTLDEVVVVGYGTQKKVNLTGAVSAVSSDDLKNRVETNVLSAIQGSVPGVTVISRPGQTPSINFRGRGNLGTSAPLYVIDGAIADATFFSNLDPNSIESISFLKDAASAAIYGSRAAYGVVLVQTKSGKKEKMSVNYNGYVGLESPSYIPELVDSWEYAEILNDGYYNRNSAGGKFQAYSQEEIGWFKDGSRPDYYPNSNWYDLVLDKQTVVTQHSLNFSGGSDKVRFFTGLGYLYNDDMMPGKSSQRYNLDMNIASDVTSWLTLKAGVKFIRNTNKTDNGIPELLNFIRVPTFMVGKQSNGEWGSIAGGRQATQSYMTWNPLRELSKDNWSTGKTDKTMYDLGIEIRPFKGLTLRGQGVFNGSESKSKSYVALQDNVKAFETGVEIPGTGVYTNSMTMNWGSETRMLYTGTAQYDYSIKKHSLQALVGTSYEHYKFERLYVQRQDFPSDGLTDIETGGTLNKNLPSGTGVSEYKMLSYFGRINYNYNERYLFEVNLRSDASSRFYKNNRWGVFPSFSAAWRINQEGWLKNTNWIDNLKIRASWGTLGNINNVGNYDYFQNYNNGANYSFDDTAVKGVRESKPANINLGWETVKLTDIGVDMDIFQGLLSLTADYYIKKTNDILLVYNVPFETGIGNKPSQNLASVENKGFEFSLTHRKKFGEFSYQVSANLTTNNNKITDLANSNDIINNGGGKIRYIQREGESIGSFYGYKTDGLYTQEEIDAGKYYTFGRKPNAGDIKYVPQRKDIEYGSPITGDDLTIIGCDVPNFTYGLNLNLQYKDFEFSIFGQGVSGAKVAFEAEQVFCIFTNSTPRKFHRLRWTENNPNPRAVYPRSYGGHSLDDYNQYFSDYQLFDADYFRIKTMTLAYRVPSDLLSKSGISNLKFFLTGENLFTIRADKVMKDFDPESPSGRGLGALGTKNVALGVNVSF